MGIGWRAGFGSHYGLIGSYQGIVELTLREPIRVLNLLNFTRIAVSLEEPEAFLQALDASS